jgi:hypothetical protein
MINAFNELTTYSGNDWDDFLEKCSLINIFKPILDRYKDNGLRRLVIQYIVKCYSLDSPDIVIGMEWGRMKKIIFEKLMLPQLMYHEMVLFENMHDLKEGTDEFEFEDKIEKDKDITALRKSITMWLNMQDSEVYVQFAVLRDLRQEMQASATKPIKKSSGEIDYDQKFKNAKYAMELHTLSKNIEEELIQNSETLKIAVQEVKNKKVKSTFGFEQFLK